MPDRVQALALMQENFTHNPEFTGGYWFPNADEFRLIYVDPTVLPTGSEEGIATFRMNHEDSGITIPMSVGIVRPDEVGVVPLPVRWRQGWQDGLHVLAPVPVA